MKNNLEIIPAKEYQWSSNWANRIAHTDINLVISELSEIEDIHGKITAQIVIESSKNKRSALYGYFEWDNEKAANSWRLQQAAKLLRHIEVKVVKDGEPKTVRVYETINRSFDKTVSLFKRFDTLTDNDKSHVLSVIVSDLRGIKTRLDRLGYANAVAYVDKAIEELSKESTETKEEQPLPVLAAV